MNSDFTQLDTGKKIFFASDFHLGYPNAEESLIREKKLVRWLDSIKPTAQALFLVGDLFDFWFEYKTVVPKSHIRFLGKLTEFSDAGIPIIIFSGNHDLWFKEYLEVELGATIIHKPSSFLISDTKFHIAHGDGLESGITKFKILKKIFTNSLCKWMFSWIHPDMGIALANLWSKKSKDAQKDNGQKDDQYLIDYCNKTQQKLSHDYYIFGDTHLTKKIELEDGATYINLGEWVERCSFATFDGNQIETKYFQS